MASENLEEVKITTWDPEEKEAYVNLMKEIHGISGEIMKVMAGGVAIVNKDLIKSIKMRAEKNKIYLDKLEKNIFEIAIVGLEKAGKSTFVNALIENKILPAQPERCTYTSTQLMYGEDEANVEFFTADEFNEIFHSMLKELEYPGADKMNFDMLNFDDFNKFFKQLETTNPMLYKQHVGKLEEDIRTIIKGKKLISEYLNEKPQLFKGEEIDSEQLRLFITDSVKSRAVKKIIIKSSKLHDLENCVLYDVPGFDSPTKIHEDQTLERLRQADAIILVTNVGRNPNLRGTEISILHRNSDSDGIALKDKLFIFGNQIDTVNSKDEAVKNVGTLANDAKKYDMARKGRVVVGSALAYLQNKKKADGAEVADKLNEFGMADGIEKIKGYLVDYYKNERFEILKQRINTNIADFRKSFEEVIKENAAGASIQYVEEKDNEIFGQLLDSSRENLKNELANLRMNLMQEILSKKYFTEKLKLLIGTKFNHITVGDINQTTIKVSRSGSTEFPVEKVNNEIRDNIHQKFRNEFTKIIIELAGEKINEINSRIIETFLKSLTVEKGKNAYYDKLREEVQKSLIEKLTDDSKYDERSFTHLIERFSRCLLDILILYPLTSRDRIKKFEASEQSLYSLALYYDLVNYNLPLFAQPMIEMLLSHRITIKREAPAEKSKNTQPKENSSSKNNGSDNVSENLTVDYSGSIFEKMNELIKKAPDKRVEITRDRYIEELRQNSKEPMSAQDVLEEINKDIDYLSILLKTSVLKAINLEEAFSATMTNNIDNLIDGIYNKKTESGASLFREFINHNYNIIMPEEFSRIANERALTENRMKIVKQLIEILNKIKALKN